jgi:YD repeat-containing protein
MPILAPQILIPSTVIEKVPSIGLHPPEGTVVTTSPILLQSQICQGIGSSSGTEIDEPLYPVYNVGGQLIRVYSAHTDIVFTYNSFDRVASIHDVIKNITETLIYTGQDLTSIVIS